jgi:CRP/FNR family transcriptional regulator, cyclic AMP receptor protein
MSAMADSLREIPLFSELSARDRKRLAGSMQERHFAAGDTVVAEGDRGIGFFVILDGHASVTRDGEPRGTLTPGDYFGEMSLIDGEDRAATVTADDALRCAAMTQWHFRPFVKDHPDVAWAMLRVLAARVRDSQTRSISAG